uniref:Diphthine--ammonia ligase n=1 Tax=Coccidioides posadasii RMSCC 3488 TaxID=454284 RepID=A0A0J6FHW3_COCPO|nr:ATP-binding domain-containing protein 4 [Coccidioides posadasii RMSCC 3488]
MDSYMYQTIGYSIIPLYQEALDVPLYRREIRGTAVNTARDYQTPATQSRQEGGGEEGGRGGGEEDETECLLYLLQDVMRAHPEVNAVSAGAILSTYQRTRIENVAGRLGLVPLAWLWMYPYLPPPVQRAGLPARPVAAVAGLLEDMAACGCEARIIKVASGGMDEGMLWENVSAGDGRLRRVLVKRMGMLLEEGVEGAVLGEGGDCVEKMGIDDMGSVNELRIPQLFDDGFKLVYERILASTGQYALRKESRELPYPEADKTWAVETLQSKMDNIWVISNLSAPEAGQDSATQMKSIMTKLTDALRTHEQELGAVTPDDIVYTTILLRSMDDFASINSVYGSLFTKPNPPARATVACGNRLPPGIDILVSFILDLGSPVHRKGLHVQSRSYWAPANIGPYSQAVGVPRDKQSGFEQDGGLVYIAGQIPLDPASMELARPDVAFTDPLSSFIHHTVLSLQHLWRIGGAMCVNWWLGAVAFIAQDTGISSKAAVASDIWERMNTGSSPSGDEDDEEDSMLDAWDIKYGRKQDFGSNKKATRALPDFGIVGPSSKIPPFLAVEVDELPRGSDIEWQGLGVRSAHVDITEDSSEGISISHSEGAEFGTHLAIGIEKVKPEDVEKSIEQAMYLARRRLKDGTHYQATIYTPLPALCVKLLAQIVPCRSVWGCGGRELSAALVLHSRSSQGSQ